MVRRGYGETKVPAMLGRADGRVNGAEIVALAAFGQAPAKKTAGGDGLGVLHWPGMGWWGLLCHISCHLPHVIFGWVCLAIGVWSLGGPLVVGCVTHRRHDVGNLGLQTRVEQVRAPAGVPELCPSLVRA